MRAQTGEICWLDAKKYSSGNLGGGFDDIDNEFRIFQAK